MANISPSSRLHLIYDVVDVGTFCNFYVCHSLLPTSYLDSSKAPSFTTSESALYLLVCPLCF